LEVSPERTKRIKLMLIEDSLHIPKSNQLDVSSPMQSSNQAQGKILLQLQVIVLATL
jgi:hypothetical protein